MAPKKNIVSAKGTPAAKAVVSKVKSRAGRPLGIPNRRKSKATQFQRCIYKVLKQVHPELGISSRGMDIMNSFIMDVFEKLALESSKVIRYNKKHTLGSREI